MIYEFMRMMAGSVACNISDFYIHYQHIFNTLLVIGIITWRIYKNRKVIEE